MQSVAVVASAACLTLFAFPRGAVADVVPIGPFSGTQHEPLNFDNTRISANQPIFGGNARLMNPSGITFIHLLLADTFGGDTVTARTGQYILGWTQDPGRFMFSTPVTDFGAYWNNNSHGTGAAVRFYDASNNLLATLFASIPSEGNVWYWSGWHSDTPISYIDVVSNGPFGGFIWTDDLEMIPVPGPGCGAAAAAAALLATRRRRG